MNATISGKWEGLEPCLERLAALPAKIERKVLRRAVSRASAPVLKAIRAKTPVRILVRTRSGEQALVPGRVLRRSLIRVIRTGHGRVLAVIGPRTGAKQEIGTVARGPRKGQPVYEDPSHIAHLVEFGHEGPHSAGPHSFVRAGWDEKRTEAARTLEEEILVGVEREA